MEIYQTNELTKEELMTFFDDVKSNLNISFLQQVPIEIFYGRSLLKDNGNTIEFENTEFQEYLAAKEILRLGRTDQVIFDLAVDQELREIFPSWFNTLGFVIDFDISLLKSILFFGASKNNTVQDEEYHRFLTKVDTQRLSVRDRKEIFISIFTYYQTVLHLIHNDVAKNLSHYFDISQHNLLEESIDGRKNKGNKQYIKRGNVACIVEFLLERGALNSSEKEYWKDTLITFVQDIINEKDIDEKGVMQRRVLSALAKFNDIELIKKVSHLFEKNDELKDQIFLLECKEINPNHPYSIQCFVEGTKRENISARYGLWEIKKKTAVKCLLNYFVEDPDFISQFIDQENIYDNKDNQIIQNVKNVWDIEVQIKLQEIIRAAFSSPQYFLAEDSNFIRNVVFLLKEKNKNYIFTLLSTIRYSYKLMQNIFSFENIFSLILEKEQVDSFVRELKKFDHGKRLALWTLQHIKFSRREDAEAIYEAGRKYFSKEYKESEENWKKQKQRTSVEQRIYTEFQYKLKPCEGKYDASVFSFYLKNKEKIAHLITQEEKERLKQLTIGSVFEKFDPGEQKLTITQNGENSNTYTTHQFIHIFGDCLQVAKELRIDISAYRQKIINYIPFAYFNHIEVILALVPDPTDEEINNLLKVYKEERSDDLPKFMPGSFIEASKEYKLTEAIPILRNFLENHELSIYDRKSALKAITVIQPNEKYLKDIFDKNVVQEDDTYQLAEDANEYLIEKFLNNEAITWRFRALQGRSFPFIRKRSRFGGEVGHQESEFMDKRFARPIMNLKDLKYKEEFLNLLDNSLELYKKGTQYHSYATYLWEIIVTYFDNLKEFKSYSHLKDLEDFVKKISSQEGINWFTIQLQRLKREYMNYIGRPQNISECIKQYNKLKEIQYLDIATSQDLAELVKKVINDDIRRWVESDGAYKYIQKAKETQEELIQKSIKTQFENSLLKKGFRENEINIQRESQLLDDKRTDFLIFYGFIGPVLIEVKRVDNQEIVNDVKREKYKKKLLQYIDGTNSKFGIFLIFQINDKYYLDEYQPKVEAVYQDYNNIEVIGLNCLVGIYSFSEIKFPSHLPK